MTLQYCKAYDTIMSIMDQDKYLNDVKIRNGDDFIKYYIMKDIFFQNSKNEFNSGNIYKKNGLLELSKKYSDGKLNQYKSPPILPKDLKRYKGPNLFIYFSKIENDTLKVDIFNNPDFKYSKSSVNKFVIVFEGASIIKINYWQDYYN
ncbi:hypothetical protein [Algoriella sp.]|uniref:hypothetical protein n=1 Tax=Algoriella sp. TaxID=1872434 RepID=UPI002FC5F072